MGCPDHGVGRTDMNEYRVKEVIISVVSVPEPLFDTNRDPGDEDKSE